MVRPQIYVHPCLDLVPPQSMGSLLRSLWRERRGPGARGRGSLVEFDWILTIGRTVSYGGCGRLGGVSFGGLGGAG